MPEAQPIPNHLYVSSVEGRLVSRYGTARGGSGNELIGATRTATPVTRQDANGKDQRVIHLTGPADDWTITWQPDRVVLISEQEYRRFRREYDGHLAAGDLRKRSRADFDAQRQREIDAEKEAIAKAAAEAKAAEAKAQGATAPAEASAQPAGGPAA